MCGRGANIRSYVSLEANTGAAEVKNNDCYQPSYNRSPGQYIPVLYLSTTTSQHLILDCMYWGIKSSGNHNKILPNARAESIAKKPSFSPLVDKYRCIILLDGFYEWEHKKKEKKNAN